MKIKNNTDYLKVVIRENKDALLQFYFALRDEGQEKEQKGRLVDHGDAGESRRGGREVCAVRWTRVERPFAV